MGGKPLQWLIEEFHSAADTFLFNNIQSVLSLLLTGPAAQNKLRAHVKDVQVSKKKNVSFFPSANSTNFTLMEI